MELYQVLGVFRRWWWLMVLSTAIAGLCSWYVIKDQPPVYQTSTTLMIGQTIENPDPTYADLYTGERLAQTYSELVRREPILRKTAAALGYEEQWRNLRGQVSASLVAGTQLLEIRVTDTDRQRAKLIADQVAIQLRDTVNTQDSQEIQFIRAQRDTFPPKIQAAQQEIQKLEAELAQSFSARQVQEIQSQINSLRTQITSWQSTYAQYQLLLREGSVNVLEIIEDAPLPTAPIGPNRVMQIGLACFIGLAVALAAALLLEYMDDTLKSPADVSRLVGLGTLGVITRIAGKDAVERMVTLRQPKSPISEAYRTMRTNLQFSALDKPLRTLVVTSASPKEGKSTTLANLGVVMAQAGKSVVLVDSDLRRPMLHRLFQIPNREGLTNLLLQEEPVLNGALQKTGVENLRVLTSGPLPPNPSELLGSRRMQRLLAELKEEADVILFDTPPALAVTDAAVLASQADGVLVVADAGRTRRAAARQAVDTLRQVGANPAGVVMNRLSTHGSGRGYYYYYYYYYYDSGGNKKRRQRKKE